MEIKNVDIFAGHSFNSGHVYNGAVYRPNSRDASANDSKLNNSANSGYGDQVSFSHWNFYMLLRIYFSNNLTNNYTSFVFSA